MDFVHKVHPSVIVDSIEKVSEYDQEIPQSHSGTVRNEPQTTNSLKTTGRQSK